MGMHEEDISFYAQLYEDYLDMGMHADDALDDICAFDELQQRYLDVPTWQIPDDVREELCDEHGRFYPPAFSGLVSEYRLPYISSLIERNRMATTIRKQPPARKPTTVSPPKKSASKAASSEGGLFGKPPVTIFCYGPSGVGKTSLWAHMPNPMFIVDPQEEGIEDLVEFGQAPEPHSETIIVDSYSETLRTLRDVENGKFPGVQSIILDSATGFEKLTFHHHCETQFGGDWSKEGFYAFQQGPKNAAKTDWPRLLDACDNVRRAGINVIMVAHSQVKSYNNPEGADYDQYIPYLDKETWQQTHRWAKAVLFYNHSISTEKKGLKTKAKVGSEQRFLYTGHSATYAAKNRWGLPALIDAGESGKEAFDNFAEAFRKASS